MQYLILSEVFTFAVTLETLNHWFFSVGVISFTLKGRQILYNILESCPECGASFVLLFQTLELFPGVYIYAHYE